jgi:hypothetical protein
MLPALELASFIRETNFCEVTGLIEVTAASVPDAAKADIGTDSNKAPVTRLEMIVDLDFLNMMTPPLSSYVTCMSDTFNSLLVYLMLHYLTNIKF